MSIYAVVRGIFKLRGKTPANILEVNATNEALTYDAGSHTGLATLHTDMGNNHSDLVQLHTDAATLLHGDNVSIEAKLDTVHTDLAALNSAVSTAANQVTQHNDLVTIHTDTGTTLHNDLTTVNTTLTNNGTASATNLGTLHTDLTSTNTKLDTLHTDAGTNHTDMVAIHTDTGTTLHGDLTAANTARGSQTDAAAGTDTGTFSLIALIKRGLASLTTLNGAVSTAANQVTQHNDLVSIHTDTGTTLHTDLTTINTTLTSNGAASATNLSTLHADLTGGGQTTSVFFPNTSLTGALAADQATLTLALASGFSTWKVQVTGVFVGTLLFEISQDNINWYSEPLTILGGSADTLIPSTTVPNEFTGFVPDANYVRVRMHPFTSGSAAIAMQVVSVAGFTELAGSLPAGSSVIGGIVPCGGGSTANQANVTALFELMTSDGIELTGNAYYAGALGARGGLSSIYKRLLDLFGDAIASPAAFTIGDRLKALETALGAPTDATATTDSGSFSLLSFVKRLNTYFAMLIAQQACWSVTGNASNATLTLTKAAVAGQNHYITGVVVSTSNAGSVNVDVTDSAAKNYYSAYFTNGNAQPFGGSIQIATGLSVTITISAAGLGNTARATLIGYTR